MNIAKLFFRERSLSKVAAVYGNAAAARSAEMKLRRLPQLHDGQVQVVYPFDRDRGRKVEPEGVGILRTAIRAHATCALIGVLAGALLFAVLYAFGLRAIVTTPGISLLAMVVYASLLGLMAGGLLTLRPDHERVALAVRDAAGKGRWSVVVHPVTRQQYASAIRALGATGATMTRTL
jgi:hypothetical protein